MAYKAWTHIIIGAGAAGCVLAYRLAKNKELNNTNGKEKVSNMIKVASLTRKGFSRGYIHSDESTNSFTLG